MHTRVMIRQHKHYTHKMKTNTQELYDDEMVNADSVNLTVRAHNRSVNEDVFQLVHVVGYMPTASAGFNAGLPLFQTSQILVRVVIVAA